MLILKDYQEKAVRGLIDESYRLIKQREYRKKLVFKAPTGAGKTIVMGEYLNRFVQEASMNLELPIREFAFIWIAPNALHIQSYEKIRDYFSETRTIRSIQFEDITNNQLQANDVLFLNWQSISSDNNIYVRDNEQDRNLSRYIEETRQNGVEIIAILDEAHLFATRGIRANDVLNSINALIEIDVSATPYFQSDNKVVIHRHDVVEEQMIKKGINLNSALSADNQASQELDYYLLDEALKKRKELKKMYEESGTHINPLLIIQLPNDRQKETVLEVDYKDRITGALSERSITTSNNKLAIWLSKEKENLDGIESFDSITEVLLFKQAIALGWDCPRAAVLLIYRELRQETFTIQTVGRILRMPEQKHYLNDVLNYGYVYTNLSRDIITIVRDDMDYFLEYKATRIPEYSNMEIVSSHINKKIIRNRLNSKYKLDLFKAAEKKFGIRKNEEAITDFYENISQIKNCAVETDIDKIHIMIPKDIEISEVKENIVRVEKDHQERFAKTHNELLLLFSQFCNNQCGEFAKFDSAPILKSALIRFFEQYFQISEQEAIKIILFQKNQQVFMDLVNESFVLYKQSLIEKAKRVEQQVEKHTWEVPAFKIYNDKYDVYDAKKHVLNPTYLFKRENDMFAASEVEFAFIQHLEQNKGHINWWYKNGEVNKADFSVDYTKSNHNKALFFVDFIIHFTNGTIGLFDTKSKGSDQEMVNKHNALIDYLEDMNNKGKSIIGGVIVRDQGSWWYPKGKIDNNNDISNWQIFDIVNLAK